jgi:predicted RecA/RadA family phage recombinase
MLTATATLSELYVKSGVAVLPGGGFVLATNATVEGNYGEAAAEAIFAIPIAKLGMSGINALGLRIGDDTLRISSRGMQRLGKVAPAERRALNAELAKATSVDEVARIINNATHKGSVSVVGASLSKLFGHNEYVVADAAKAAKVKSGLMDFYKKHGGVDVIYVDDALLLGRNGSLDTTNGDIWISKGLRDKYPGLVEGTIMEELQHFHQLKSRGWFGRELTKAEHDLLERDVVQRLLRSGLTIHK